MRSSEFPHALSLRNGLKLLTIPRLLTVQMLALAICLPLSSAGAQEDKEKEKKKKTLVEILELKKAEKEKADKEKADKEKADKAAEKKEGETKKDKKKDEKKKAAEAATDAVDAAVQDRAAAARKAVQAIGPPGVVVEAVVETADHDHEHEADDEGEKTAEAESVPVPPKEPKPPMFWMRDSTRLAGFPQVSELHVETAYGPLVIPISEVEHVRFALAADPEVAQEVAGYIEQLASEEFDLREEAEEKLREIGRPALEALEKATASEDEEVKTRAQKLLEEFEGEEEEPDEEEAHLAPLEGDEDEIKTRQFVVRGVVQEKAFEVETRYGELTFRRDDILSIVFQEPLFLKRTIDVPGTSFAGNKQWVDSEQDLPAGKPFTLTATGTVVLQNYGNINCGPSGTTNVPAMFNDLAAGALVGKIGEEGKPFLVGAEYQGTAEEAGRLYLGIALKNGNVSGKFEVTLEKSNE